MPTVCSLHVQGLLCACVHLVLHLHTLHDHVPHHFYKTTVYLAFTIASDDYMATNSLPVISAMARAPTRQCLYQHVRWSISRLCPKRRKNNFEIRFQSTTVYTMHSKISSNKDVAIEWCHLISCVTFCQSCMPARYVYSFTHIKVRWMEFPGVLYHPLPRFTMQASGLMGLCSNKWCQTNPITRPLNLQLKSAVRCGCSQ